MTGFLWSAPLLSFAFLEVQTSFQYKLNRNFDDTYTLIWLSHAPEKLEVFTLDLQALGENSGVSKIYSKAFTNRVEDKLIAFSYGASVYQLIIKQLKEGCLIRCADLRKAIALMPRVPMGEGSKY